MSERFQPDYDAMLDEFVSTYTNRIKDIISKEESRYQSVAKSAIEKKNVLLSGWLMFGFIFVQMRDALGESFSAVALETVIALAFLAWFLWEIHSLKDSCGVYIYEQLEKKNTIKDFIEEKRRYELSNPRETYLNEHQINCKYDYILRNFPYFRFNAF